MKQGASIVVYSSNPRTQAAEEGGSHLVPGQPGLHTEFQESGLCIKTKQQQQKACLFQPINRTIYANRGHPTFTL